MKNPAVRISVWISALVSLLTAWAVVIWVALEVSRVVLNTLSMIVELAAISP